MDHADAALRLLVAVFATWRVAHLLAFEDGPWGVVARLRHWAGPRGAWLDCFQCLSLWAAAAMALWIATSLAGAVCVALGLSGAACLLQRLTAAPVQFQALADERPAEVPVEGPR